LKLIFAMLLLAAAACGENERAGSADAARADSSAAGYVVGRRADGAHRDTARVDSITKAGGRPVPNDAAARAALAATRTDTSTKGRPVIVAAAHQATAGNAPAGSRDSASRADTAHTKVPNAAATKARTDSAARAATPAGPVRVNEFLTYDARSRTVSLQLISGYNGLNGSLNYNGSINGSHGLIVPTGWHVHVAVTNRDSDLQHSAIVLAKVLPPPIEPADPAFEGAALPRLDEGLQEDETGTIDFVATRPGHFMIACGVPGHAQAGEWLELVVTNSSLPPTYR
jgi:hypothetical protein